MVKPMWYWYRKWTVSEMSRFLLTVSGCTWPGGSCCVHVLLWSSDRATSGGNTWKLVTWNLMQNRKCHSSQVCIEPWVAYRTVKYYIENHCIPIIYRRNMFIYARIFSNKTWKDSYDNWDQILITFRTRTTLREHTKTFSCENMTEFVRISTSMWIFSYSVWEVIPWNLCRAGKINKQVDKMHDTDFSKGGEKLTQKAQQAWIMVNSRQINQKSRSQWETVLSWGYCDKQDSMVSAGISCGVSASSPPHWTSWPTATPGPCWCTCCSSASTPSPPAVHTPSAPCHQSPATSATSLTTARSASTVWVRLQTRRWNPKNERFGADLQIFYKACLN